MTGHDHSHSHHDHDHDDRWKHDGVRVIPGNQLDTNVPSTAGMDRAAAINFARVGAQKLWAGTVSIKPDATDAGSSTPTDSNFWKLVVPAYIHNVMSASDCSLVNLAYAKGTDGTHGYSVVATP